MQKQNALAYLQTHYITILLFITVITIEKPKKLQTVFRRLDKKPNLVSIYTLS